MGAPAPQPNPSPLQDLSRRYLFEDAPPRQGRCLIYRARDRRLQRPVAIKVLREEDQTEEGVAALLQEAWLTARLEHPAIPAVHDLGRLDDGRSAFVMEWIEGQPLFKRFPLGQPPGSREMRSLLKVMIKACEALEVVHKAGRVHGAIEEENLLVGTFGEVHLVDWSRARPIDARAPGAERDGRCDVAALVGLLRRSLAVDSSPRLVEAEGRTSARELKEDLERTLSSAWRTREETFEAGALILAQGEDGDRACQILSGACEVTREVNGERQELGALGPGDTFGEVAIVTGEGRTASVRARATTVVRSYERASFDDWLKLDGEAAGFLSFLVRRLTERDHELYELDRTRRENEAAAEAVAWLARRGGAAAPLGELCRAIAPRVEISEKELLGLIEDGGELVIDEHGLAGLAPPPSPWW